MSAFYFNTVPEHIRIDGSPIYTDFRSPIPPSKRAVFHGFTGKSIKHMPGENKWRKHRIDQDRTLDDVSEMIGVDNKIITRIENNEFNFAQVTKDKLYLFYPQEWVDKIEAVENTGKSSG